MDYSKLDDSDLDSLMEKIRQEINPALKDIEKPSFRQDSCIKNAIAGRQLQLDGMMQDASVGLEIGRNLPPMYRMHGLKRRLAIFTGKIFLRVARIITQDICTFNNAVLIMLDSIRNYISNSAMDVAVLQQDIGEQRKIISNSAMDVAVLQQDIGEQRKIISNSAMDVAALQQDIGEQRKIISDLSSQVIDLQKEKQLNNIALSDLREQMMKINDILTALPESNNQLLQQVIEKTNNNEVMLVSTQNNLQSLKSEVSYMVRQNKRLKNRQDNVFDGGVQPSINSAIGISRIDDRFYSEFEDVFRGTREDIKSRIQVYIPYIEQCYAGSPDRPIIDLGCGRGEWLEVLKARGLRAQGVDINEKQIAKCRELGLEAYFKDAVAALKEIPDNNFGAVTAFHLIEHLSFENLMDLMSEVLRVLKPGGAAIFETPNPQNLVVGATNFYLDPTHNRPLHPMFVKFIAEQIGYVNIEIKLVNPMPEACQLLQPIDQANQVTWQHNLIKLNDLLYGPQDYSIIGWKI